MYNHVQSVKELLRHALHTSGLEFVLRRYKNLRGFTTDHLNSDSLEERFRQVYATGVWVHKQGQESMSGLGSETRVVHAIAQNLSEHLRELNAQSVVDIGCGDFRSFKDCPFDGLYIGLDIVADVIEENRRRYRSHTREFRKLDAVAEPIPQADVVLLREVMFHLSFEDGRQLLRHVASSSTKYLVATNDSGIWFNSDISSGDFRKLNLLKRPFRFPAPFHVIDDGLVAEGRVLATWRVEDLPIR